jgi:hypothetical protein
MAVYIYSRFYLLVESTFGQARGSLEWPEVANYSRFSQPLARLEAHPWQRMNG